MLPIVAYESLLQGATGFSFLDVKGDTITLAISRTSSIPEKAARASTNTMQTSAPLVLTGLAVGLGFKGGLFNIGGTGQVLVGGFSPALVGAAVADQPVPIAVTIAVTRRRPRRRGLRASSRASSRRSPAPTRSS